MTRTITFDRTMQDGDQRAAFRHALDDMGVTLASSSSFERAFTRVKAAADHEGHVSGARFRAIVDEVESGMEVFQGVADTFR
ncbi:MAG TPA: hypothetical protein VK969_11330 [Acidimicrobiia bacterium]|nr:hypothetical protein [Acidimicrobiia bacterium]